MKETRSGFKPCGEFVAPVIQLLILVGSNHLNFSPCEGENSRI